MVARSTCVTNQDRFTGGAQHNKEKGMTFNEKFVFKNREYTIEEILLVMSDFKQDFAQHFDSNEKIEFFNSFCHFKKQVVAMFASYYNSWTSIAFKQIVGETDFEEQMRNYIEKQSTKGKGRGGKGTSPSPSTSARSSSQSSAVNTIFTNEPNKGPTPSGTSPTPSSAPTWRTPSARTTPAGWKGSSRTWRPFNQHRNTNFAGNNQFHQQNFNQFAEHFNQKLRNLENIISKMNEESERNFTKRMVEIESKIFNQYQKSVDFNTKMLEEKLTDVVFKTMDHDSFMNMVDKKFDHLNHTLRMCVNMRPGKVFKDSGVNTIEHFIYDSDGFEKSIGNSNYEEKRDFKKESRNSLELLQWNLIQEYEAEIDTLKAEISTLRAPRTTSPPTYKEVVTQVNGDFNTKSPEDKQSVLDMATVAMDSTTSSRSSA